MKRPKIEKAIPEYKLTKYPGPITKSTKSKIAINMKNKPITKLKLFNFFNMRTFLKEYNI